MAKPTPASAHAPPQPFVVKGSSIQGSGGYAIRDIKAGERVIEYVGERISAAECDRRYDDAKMSRHHTFLFTVTSRIIIDAAVNGNDARFINHSCDPNCEAIDEGGRIFIYAMKPIANGEELLYDYGYARDTTTTEEDEQLYVCRCGSPKCRGTILEPPKKVRKRAHHPASRQPHHHRAVEGPGVAASKKNTNRNGAGAKEGARLQ